MIDILKNLFDKFLLETKDKSVYKATTKVENFNLNSDVFEFQSHIAKQMKDLNLNLVLNPEIHSKSITSSFGYDIPAFSPNDYCFSFFDFLNVRRNDRLELYQLIDSFLELHKEEMTWKDIVITASGATRCRTNLRFALERLRRIGLIRKFDKDGKRVVTPTIQGEIVFFYWRKQLADENLKTKTPYDHTNHPIIQECQFYKLYDILNTVTHIEDSKLIEFWNNKEGQQFIIVEENPLSDIRRFLAQSIITENGIYLKDDKS